MQFSIVPLKEIKGQQTLRLDAEYWHPELIDISNKIQLNSAPLGELIKHGYRVVYDGTEILPDAENTGDLPKFLQATDIESPMINIEKSGYVSNEDWLRYEKGRVIKGEILLEVKGNVEKVAIVPNDFPEKVLISGTLYKFTVKKNINKYFLAVYLSCGIGQKLKNRLLSNVATPFISKSELYNIPVPMLDKKLQDSIKDAYLLLLRLRKKASYLYAQSQSILLAELGLSDWRPKHRLTYVKNYSAVKQAKRFDADYFQPKYDEIVNAIKHYSGGCDTLGNLTHMKKCVEVGSEEYLDDGIPFVRVSNINPFDITRDKYISNELYRELDAHQPMQGEILLTKDATPGNAYYLNEQPQKMILSSGVLRLSIKSPKVNGEYLTLVLNSILTKEQINRDVGGSIILHWRPDQAKNMLIPILDDGLQAKIQQKVAESFALRKHSKRLLECAKRAVEIAIEQDEKTALNWLKTATSNTAN